MNRNQIYSAGRFRKALFHFLTGHVAQTLSIAIHVLITVRLLPLSDYGIYMLVVGIPEMILPLASFGILNLGQRYLPRFAGTINKKSILRISIIMLLLEAAILLLLALTAKLSWPFISTSLSLNIYQATVINYIIALAILFPLFHMTCEFMDAMLGQKASQLMRAILPIGKILSILILIFANVKIELYDILLIDCIVTGLCLSGAIVLLYRIISDLPSHGGDLPDTKEMVRFAWHMTPVNIFGATATPGSVRLAAAGSLSIVDVGLFGFLQSIRKLVQKLLPGSLFMGIVRPIIINRTMLSGNLDILQHATNLFWKMNNLLIGAICLIVIVAGDSIVYFVSGGKYEGAGITLLLILVALSISAQRQTISMMIQVIGYTEILRKTAIISPLALFFIWLSAGEGLDFVIIIFGISVVIKNAINLLMLRNKNCNVILDFKGNLKIILSVVFASSVGIITHYYLGYQIFAAILSFLLYLAMLLAVKPLHSEELKLFEKGIGTGLSKYMGFIRSIAGA